MRNPSARAPQRHDAALPLRARAVSLKARAKRAIAGAADTTWPDPGSDAARAQFRAACREVDRVIHTESSECDPSLKLENGIFWTRHSLDAALAAGGIQVLDYAGLWPLAAEREARIDAAARATNLHVLHALAFADMLGADSGVEA